MHKINRFHLKEKTVTRIFSLLALFLFSILFYYSIGMTWENTKDPTNEFVYFHPDSIPWNIWWLGIALLLFFLIYRAQDRFLKRINMTALAGIVCLTAALFSIYWVNASNTGPQADQNQLCDLAQAFDLGDCSSLERGGYAGKNIHQLGMITILRILFRLFGAGNYRAFQYFSALLVPLIIFSGYRIVKRITLENKHAELSYLLLMLFCVPLYGYVPFVYGEICSLAFLSLSAWMLLDSLYRFSPVKAVLLGISMGLAILMRQNTLIFLIAFAIVIAVKLIDRRRIQTAVIGICLLAGAAAGQLVIQAIYSPLIPADSKPTPSILYIVMGTDIDDNSAGWYNGYHDRVYKEYDYDPEQASQQGYSDLKAFMETCMEDPAYATEFYYKKMNTQWNVPMYQCLAMNNLIVGSQSPLAENVYSGTLRDRLKDFTNIYQLLIYGGVLALLLLQRKRWTRIESYVLLIGIFGGFLFSLIWEAKTRYVFPYFIMMIPYAAAGIPAAVRWLEKKAARSKGAA